MCGNTNYWHILAFVIYSVLEYCLGKTTRIKSSSTLELVLNILKFVILKVYQRRT